MTKNAGTIVENRQPRCPCVLVLDSSYSMKGAAIAALNEGITVLPRELRADAMASKRVELAIVGFPPVQTLHGFATADAFVAPTLRPDGSTPLGAAVLHALDLVEQRKAYYRHQHLEWFRPVLFLMTDGAPDFNDPWEEAAAAARLAEATQKLSVIAVAVPGAEKTVLAKFSHADPIALVDLRFREMFEWLSRSLPGAVDLHPQIGGARALPTDVSGVVDWGTL